MAELSWIERTFQAAQKAAADAEDTSRVKIVYRGGVVVGVVHVTAQTNYDQFKAIMAHLLRTFTHSPTASRGRGARLARLAELPQSPL